MTKKFLALGGLLFALWGCGSDPMLSPEEPKFGLESRPANSNCHLFPGEPPQLLSQTGCFSNQDPKIPSQGLIPYDVNVPLWSDGAAKQRWMALPDGSRISLVALGKWNFPTGTVLIKSFSLGDRLIETRFLLREDSGSWKGYSYEWNEAGSDAELVPEDGKEEIIAGLTWTFPSRTHCFRCHTPAADYVLGLNNPNMDKLFQYPSGIGSNQIETLVHIGLFEGITSPDQIGRDPFPDFADEAQIQSDIAKAARAYLDVNCSMCHQPQGTTPSGIDFRAATPFQDMNVCDAIPMSSDLGIPEARILRPGDPETSILYQRMKSSSGSRMPPLGTTVPDEEGSAVVEGWIRGLTSCD